VLIAPDDAGPTDRPGRLLAIEGIDGSGKSTAAGRLASRIRQTGRRTLLLDRGSATEALTGYVGEHLAGVRTLIWDYPPEARSSQLGFEHWRHLLLAWFHAVDHVTVRPALADGTWVVADSWFYKYAARFALTCGLADAEQCFRGLSVPSAVFWLDVDPGVCAQRRVSPRATEKGEWLELDGSERAFVDYQRRVRDVYVRLAGAHSWSRIDLDDAEAAVDRMCDQLFGEVFLSP
jgi:dTMP kinase